MAFNPFTEKAGNLENCLIIGQKIPDIAYNKLQPYTKARLSVAAAAEAYSRAFSHCFHQNCSDNDIRRSLSLMRRIEHRQFQTINSLLPKQEAPSEKAISCEIAEISLIAACAQNESDKYVKSSLNFTLIEDFDHLYRFFNLAKLNGQTSFILDNWIKDNGIEIMPGRPTISQHRFPYDDVKRNIATQNSLLQTKINIHLSACLHNYALNLYSSASQFSSAPLENQLFDEIATIEEQHLTHSSSLSDPSQSQLAKLLLNEVIECYIYLSLYADETNPQIKGIFKQCLTEEITHAQKARELLIKYENRDYDEVIGNGNLPQPFAFERNGQRSAGYIRHVLKSSAVLTGMLEDLINVNEMPQNSLFFKYNHAVDNLQQKSPSRKAVEEYIAEFGTDFRIENQPHPIPTLRDRKNDNISFGRE